MRIFNNIAIESYAIEVLALVSFLVKPIGYRLQLWLAKSQVSHLKITTMTAIIMCLSIISTGFFYTGKIWIMLIFLTIGRVIQGITLGVQSQGTLNYIKTIFPNRIQNTVVNSIIGAQLGLTCAALVYKVLYSHLTPQEMEFGWHIPFFLGGGLCFALLIYRILLIHFGYIKFAPDYNTIKPLDNIAVQCGRKLWLSLILASTRGCLFLTLFILLPGVFNWILGWDSAKITNIMLAVSITNTISTWFCQRLHMTLKQQKLLIFFLFCLIPVSITLGISIINNAPQLIIINIAILSLINGYLYMVISKFIESLFPQSDKMEVMLFIDNFQFFGYNFIRQLSLFLIVMLNDSLLIKYHLFIFIMCALLGTAAVGGIISIISLRPKKFRAKM